MRYFRLPTVDLLPRKHTTVSTAGRRPKSDEWMYSKILPENHPAIIFVVIATRQASVQSGRRPRTGKSLAPRTLVSSEVRSTLASLRCSSLAMSVSKLSVRDATRLTNHAADLESELLRLVDLIRSTRADLRRRTFQLRRRLRFHAVTALGGVRRIFDVGLAEPFGEVRERSPFNWVNGHCPTRGQGRNN